MIQTDFTAAYARIHLPAKVVLAVTQKPHGGYNLITLEWFMRTSIVPPMFAISIGHSRFSLECLETTRFFNLVFPASAQKALLTYCGSNSGRDLDKFTETGVEYFPGKLRKLPILKDATANFECEIVSQVRSGDHNIYVGQVHYTWLNKENELFYYIH
ncbi:MAG: flavin reductase family protein [Candidatus Cloacimonetes bacterium]|nr:flavin reductase family protein [Candidatus Cloacimonadota bacterium]